MAPNFQNGKYTIVNPRLNKVIGAPPTKPTVRPLVAVAEIGTIQDHVFSIEHAGTGPWGLPVYRISLDEQAVTADGGDVVVNAALDPGDATVWIIERKSSGLYGLIQAYVDGDLTGAVAWTLRNNVVYEKVSLQFVTQTKSIPPQSLFKDGQLFRISHAG